MTTFRHSDINLGSQVRIQDELKNSIAGRRVYCQQFSRYQAITPLWKKQLHRAKSRRPKISLAGPKC